MAQLMKGHKGSVRAISLMLAAAAGFAILAARICQQPSSPMTQPVLIFPKSYQLPSQPASLFARWVPVTPGWGWLWRLKEVATGKVKPVEIDADIISPCGEQPLGLGAPSFIGSGSMNGSTVRVWFLEDARLKSLRNQLKTNPGNLFLNSPRITTGDGIDASLFIGQTIPLNGIMGETGVRVSYFTRGVRQQDVDLIASVSLVEALTNEAQAVALLTNLDLNARVQLPKGKGIFLVHGFDQATNQNRIGLILSTKF